MNAGGWTCGRARWVRACATLALSIGVRCVIVSVLGPSLSSARALPLSLGPSVSNSERLLCSNAFDVSSAASSVGCASIHVVE
eukprot:2643409-Heterocapsa_arctica.AAC.1